MRRYRLASFVGAWVAISSQTSEATLVKFTGDAANDGDSRAVPTVLVPNVTARGFDGIRAGTSTGDVVYALPNKYADINTARADPETNTTLSITPAAGYELTVTGLRFDVGASRVAGEPELVITALGVSWNRDNNASPLSIGFAPDSTADGNLSRVTGNVPLTATGVREPIVFRMFWAGNTNFTYFDNVEVLGTASPVPEPASAGLLLAGGTLALRRTRRRRD